MRGPAEEAVVAQTALERKRHPSWRLYDYEYELAHAWVAACQCMVSSPIKTAPAAERLTVRDELAFLPRQ